MIDTSSPLLNYSLINQKDQQQAKIQAKPPLVLIHGLFGNLDNLGLLARDLVTDYKVISIDLRNHGQSFHDAQMSYPLMAQDIKRLLDELNIASTIVIGHSMGGKAAMALADLAPELVSQLIVLDMSPVAYSERRHDHVFAGLRAVKKEQPTNRREALNCLAKHIEMEGVRQFLSKSLYQQDGVMQWRFNVDAIYSNYNNILGWQPISPFKKPTLFLKGANSDYIQSAHQSEILNQFPNSKAHIIANTGHWLHAEKPNEVIRAIRRFLLR